MELLKKEKSAMYYTKTHEWIEKKEGKGRVGMTQKAQKEFGEIVYV